jgi:hypothetical protein
MIVSAVPDSNGIALIEFVTDDQNGGILRDTMTYTITPVNDAPVYNGAISYTFAEDTGKVFLGLLSDYFYDVDRDNLITTATGSPSLFTTTESSDSLFFHTLENVNGVDSLILSSDDGTIITYQTIAITISPRNDLPAVLKTPSLVINEDAGVVFVDVMTDVFDADIDGDILTFESLVSQGSTIVTSNIRNDSLFVTTIPDSNGVVRVDLAALDGSGDSSKVAFTFTVNPVNDAPILMNALPDTITIVEFSPTSLVDDLADNFRDVEGQEMTLSHTIIDHPSRLITELRNDSLFVTSIKDQLGIATIVVTSTDAGNAQTSDTVIVNVLNYPNSDPVFVATTLQNGLRAHVYNGTDSVRATDVDLDSLTYSLISGPAWLSLDGNGAITGIPTSVGPDSIVVTVTDGYEIVQTQINFFIDDVSLVNSTALIDTVILGHDSYQFSREFQSSYPSAVSYGLTYASQDQTWIDFVDTTFALNSSFSIDFNVLSSQLPRSTEELQATIYISDLSSNIVVDSFAVQMSFDRLVDYLSADIPQDSIQRSVYSGLQLNESITLANTSAQAGSSITFSATGNATNWIEFENTSLVLASNSVLVQNVSFDFTAMTETSRNGKIFVVDTEFASDTIAVFDYAFTKELIGRVVFNSSLKDSINNKTTNKSGFIMDWVIENGKGELTTQLVLKRNSVVVKTENNLNTYQRNFTNLADGDYQLIVNLQDSLISNNISSIGGDTVRFTIASAKEILAPGYWTLVSPITSSTNTVNGLITGNNVSTYYVYDNAQKDYVSANAEESNPAKAYWVKVNTGQDSVVNIRYTHSQLIGDTVVYERSVVQGWNLIGSPWNHDIYVQGLEIEEPINGTFQPFALSSTSVQLFSYELIREDTVVGYTYHEILSDNEVLFAKKGYWLKSDKDRKIRFKSVQRYNPDFVPSSTQWNATLSLKLNRETENVRFSMNDQYQEPMLTKNPPALAYKAFSARLDGDNSHAHIPYKRIESVNRYELTLQGKRTSTVHMSYNEIANGVEQFVFIQQLSTGTTLRLAAEEADQVLHLAKDNETVLVYVTSDPNFNVPFVPTKFELLQNYPNPFNPTTKIEFDLPYTKNMYNNVRLEIYNVLGQRVKTLVKGQLEARRHSYVWNGRNDAGQRVASGVYFYTIKAGTYFKTKKMVLIK